MGWINDKGSLPKFEQGGKVSRFEENQKKRKLRKDKMEARKLKIDLTPAKPAKKKPMKVYISEAEGEARRKKEKKQAMKKYKKEKALEARKRYEKAAPKARKNLKKHARKMLGIKEKETIEF